MKFKRNFSAFISLLTMLMIFQVSPKVSVQPIESNAACTSDTLISIAIGEIGNTYYKYTSAIGTVDGTYAYSWCAAFTSYCAKQAGLTDIAQTASCDYQYNNSSGTKHWVVNDRSYTPQPGDFVYYHWTGSSYAYSHVEIVEYFDSSTNTLHTIAGNSGDGSTTTRKVCRRTRAYDGEVKCFLTPNYQPQPSTPRIENVRISKITNTGYTVKCEVYDEINPVTRVAFPTWTTKTDSNGNDQDDIVWADGTISGATATFEVKISDHNNELGYYRTHIYCYNSIGAHSAAAVPDVCIEQTKPTISNVSIIKRTSTSYTIQCKVKDSGSGIDRVQFPTWTSANGQDDLILDWGTNAKARGSLNGNIATYTVNISDHNNELGKYETHIYAYDKCGNVASFGIKTVIEDTKPTISDVKIIDKTPSSYTIQCKVEDTGSGINRVQFPTWTSANGQDDLISDWGTNEFARGTINDNIVTYTVNVSDHNNEHGAYTTHIYAYDNCGNVASYGISDIIIPNNGDINLDGNVNVSDMVILQQWLLAVPNTTLECWQAADLNNDERIDVFDMVLMRRLLMEQS